MSIPHLRQSLDHNSVLSNRPPSIAHSSHHPIVPARMEQTNERTKLDEAIINPPSAHRPPNVSLGIRPLARCLSANLTHYILCCMEMILRILGVRLVSFWYSLATTRGREEFLSLNSGDVEMLYLSSIIIISNVNSNIHILYASLQDFLLDPARST